MSDPICVLEQLNFYSKKYIYIYIYISGFTTGVENIAGCTPTPSHWGGLFKIGWGA